MTFIEGAQDNVQATVKELVRHVQMGIVRLQFSLALERWTNYLVNDLMKFLLRVFYSFVLHVSWIRRFRGFVCGLSGLQR